MPRERGDDGQYRSTVEGDDVVQVFDTVRGPVVTSADVADELGVTRETARRRLNRLVDDGSLSKRKTAGRVVYWQSEPQRPNDQGGTTEKRELGDEPDVPAPHTPPTVPPSEQQPTPTDHEADTDADAPDLLEVVERVAEAEGWEDPEERLEARKLAALGVLRYAREHGTVSKSEAKEKVYPHFQVEGQNERTWYRKNVRPVLNEAAEYDSSERGYRLDVA
jgi:hypothetical protein